MNAQQFALALSVANAAMLASLLIQPHRTAAQSVAPVLRSRALELVDDAGRVRAEIKVLPAQPTLKMPDGTTGYPETVQLRLFTSKGGPNVKLAATEDGSALVLGSDPGYVQILSRGASTFVKLVNKDGRQQTVKP
ncbi:MAG TPA: hypothetical protein VN428_02570 [Bryobacteraceae bacterium]|nr:hypothetical protein [Bryobacteraceae bacterium]